MAKAPTMDDMAKELAEKAKREIIINGMTLEEFINKINNAVENSECHLASCRYNSASFHCTNEEKRKECVDVSKLVLCLKGEKCEK